MEDLQDSRTYSREFMIEFIDLYKTLPAVWKVKSKSYSDRNLKNAAYEKLISKLREVEPNADRETAVKKINNIRSSYRRELKKVKQSMHSGAGSDDVYSPTLWYFPLLSFLSDQETPRSSASNLDEPTDKVSEATSIIIFLFIIFKNTFCKKYK